MQKVYTLIFVICLVVYPQQDNQLLQETLQKLGVEIKNLGVPADSLQDELNIKRVSTSTLREYVMQRERVNIHLQAVEKILTGNTGQVEDVRSRLALIRVGVAALDEKLLAPAWEMVLRKKLPSSYEERVRQLQGR